MSRGTSADEKTTIAGGRRGRDTSPRLWLLYLVAGVIATGAYFLTPEAAQGTIYNLIGVSAVAAILVGVRRHRPEPASPWYLIALGLAVYVIADITFYNIYPNVLEIPTPYPSVADALYLFAYLLVASGLALFVRRSSGRDWGNQLDAAIVTVGLGVLYWEFVLQPQFDLTPSLLPALTSIAYALMSLLWVVLVARLVFGKSRRPVAFYLLFLAVLLHPLGDAIYTILSLNGAYEYGSPVEASWLLSYVLLGAAGLHPSMRELSGIEMKTQSSVSRWRLAVLGVAALLGPMLRVIDNLRGNGADLVMMIGIVVLISLVLARMMLLLRERELAGAALREVHDQLEARVEERTAELQEANADLEKAMAESARSRAERVRFFELAQDMIGIANFDGYFVSLNPAWERMLGYSLEELTSRPFLEFVHPEDLAATIREAEKLAAGAPTISFENRYRAKDGPYRWLSWRCTPDVEEGRIYAVARDVTEQKEAEEMLTRQAHLLDLANDAIIVRESYGVISYWNRGAEQMFGWKTEEVVGESIYELLKTKFPEPFEKIEEKLLREGSWEGELEHTKRDGERIVVASRWTLRAQEDGGNASYLEINSDITDRKAAKEQLERLNASLSEQNLKLAQKNDEVETFVYSVSHDLRSPLVNLEGFSEELALSTQDLRTMLEESNLPPDTRAEGLELIDEDITESVGFIRAGVARLSSLINALLQLSRTGRVEYDWQPVDTNAGVGRIVDSMMDTVSERGALVEVQADLPPAWSDPTALEQVFANLIGNALKYLDPGRPGRVEVGHLEPPGEPGRVTYYVRDNGRGMPEGSREKAFQIFQRLHPDVAGEGVGLALVQRIVQRHGGRVWVESEEGEGSTFFVQLTGASAQERPYAHADVSC
jgi:PAS domain S-box-containing protein